MAKLISPNINVYNESIFDSVNVRFNYVENLVPGYRVSGLSNVATVDITLQISSNIKSIEDIEDIIGKRWLKKKMGISYQDFEDQYPEFFL